MKNNRNRYAEPRVSRQKLNNRSHPKIEETARDSSPWPSCALEKEEILPPRVWRKGRHMTVEEAAHTASVDREYGDYTIEDFFNTMVVNR